ncbi:mediator of RNA polymerase II transcription subunit 22b-like [Abeliophyllum distichum]|uniref:Mediator of RNA polymerase II transcription subunit 22b-like n=1 Tax=Abeliophyllum distichum TaxID=126358 RepID=A0ABD1PP15_9LAMI
MIGEILEEVSLISNSSERLSKLDDYVNRLQDEMEKIDAFKHELPLCMLLLTDDGFANLWVLMTAIAAIATVKRDLMQCRKSSTERIFEEFIPLKKISDDLDEILEAPKDEIVSSTDKMTWMSSVQLWNSGHTDQNPVQLPPTAAPVILALEGGVGLGGGAGGGSGGGPTAAAAAAAAQKQKTLLHRVDNDIGNLVDNFGFLVNVARVNDPPVRNSQEAFMMDMRAARMVQAADSLLKLVSELKQTAIFSGFASLNDHVDQRTEEFNKLAEKSNGTLARIGEEAVASLKDLESHYYSSVLRTSIPPEP